MAGTAADGSLAESEALKQSFSYLVESIDTAALLPAALKKSLITDRLRSECSSEADPYKKAETFVGHLQRAVNGESNKFNVFVQILQETGQAHIATRLRDELAHSIRSMQQPSALSSTEERLEQVDVPDTLVEELADLRFSFAELLRSYEKKLRQSPEAQEEFVSFLPRLFRRAIEDLNFDDHFNKLIDEKVSLFNIFYLKRICSVFPEDVCATTRQLVENYEEKRQHFMSSTTVSQFKQLFPASATSPAEKIPIKLKLKNYWDKDTIEDLTKLVTLFGVSLKHFHLCKVEDGCIAVTWLCSCTAVEQLKLTLSDSRTANGLQTMGVLQVFIEDKLVLDFSKPHTTAASGHSWLSRGKSAISCLSTGGTTKGRLGLPMLEQLQSNFIKITYRTVAICLRFVDETNANHAINFNAASTYFEFGTSDVTLPRQFISGETITWGSRKSAGPFPTGTVGVFTYNSSDGNTLAVMWSVPFNFWIYYSWWNVKMYRGTRKASREIYQEMYRDADIGDNKWYGPREIGQGYMLNGSMADSYYEPTLQIEVTKQ